MGNILWLKHHWFSIYDISELARTFKSVYIEIKIIYYRITGDGLMNTFGKRYLP